MTSTRGVFVLGCLLALPGCQSLSSYSQGTADGASTQGENRATPKSAVDTILDTSIDYAVGLMSQPGQYNIALPESIASLRPTLSKLGLDTVLDRMKERMNEAASAAAAQAEPVFRDAVKEMSVPDALGLVTGGSTSVTDYFRRKTQARLADRLRPVIRQKLTDAGFYPIYRRLVDAIKAVPFVDMPQLDIETYVVEHVLDGLYRKMADKEMSIRENPKEAASKLLQALLSGSS